MRFTPTGVGNTTGKRPDRYRLAVHPHGRGEYAYFDQHPKLSDGSPPRAWEYAADLRAAALCVGSPPRAWGIHLAARLPDVAQRFTPTGVGNTSYRREPPRDEAVHPHGRGEYISIAQALRRCQGSPPRAWGIRTRHGSRFGGGRFTPTGVGNTINYLASSAVNSVHPHGRGEYIGSASLADLGTRFTPTGVGNTPQESGLAFRIAVHPHGRGEYVTAARAAA